MAKRLMLKAPHWYGMRFVPDVSWGETILSATPVLMTAAKPLKTGTGKILLEYLSLDCPGGAQKEQLVGIPRVHRDAHMVIEGVAADGTMVTRVFEEVSRSWLDAHSRRTAHRLRHFASTGDFQEDLTYYLGSSLEELQAAVSAEGLFPRGAHPMPERRAKIHIGRHYDVYESYLIRRGFMPRQMENKWLIYATETQLEFVRSWNGVCICQVQIKETPDGIMLGDALVNRDPEQYGCSDDRHDYQMIHNLVSDLLLGVDAPFPY